MKKIKLSLAALTLVLAIAGTSITNVTKAQTDVDLCSNADPTHTECLNEFPVECCEDDFTHETVNQRLPKPR